MSAIVVVAVVVFFPRVIKHSALTLRRVSLQREAGKRRKRGGRGGERSPVSADLIRYHKSHKAEFTYSH